MCRGVAGVSAALPDSRPSGAAPATGLWLGHGSRPAQSKQAGRSKRSCSTSRWNAFSSAFEGPVLARAIQETFAHRASWFYMRDHLCRSGVYARRGQEPIVRRESTLARKTGHGERVKKSPGPDTSSKRVEGRPARETAFTFVNKKQCSGTGVPPVVGL